MLLLMESTGKQAEDQRQADRDTDHEVGLFANQIISRARDGQGDDRAGSDAARAEVEFATDIAAARIKLAKATNVDQARAAVSAAANIIDPEPERGRRSAERAAMTDRLTGLANQAAFIEALSSAELDPDIDVIAFDGDRFGDINKNHYQSAGDAAIKALGAAIQTAAAHFGSTRVFRGGGDEFYVLGSTTSADKIISSAKKILAERIASGMPFPDASGADHPAKWFSQLGLSGAWAQTRNEADARVQAIKRDQKQLPLKQSTPE